MHLTLLSHLRCLNRRTKLLALLAPLMLAGIVFVSARMSRLVDTKLAEAGAGGSTLLYSAPSLIARGDSTSAEAVMSDLQRAGYSSDSSNPIGSYQLNGSALTIKPGRDSYFREEPVQIRFDGNRVAELIAVKSQAKVTDYALEPQPLARVEDGMLQRRRPVRFKDVPAVLLQALLSAEDKHFFHHAGFDPFRIAKAAWVNVRSGRKEQGGSTLTMQLARNLYLDADKTWKRKLEEVLIAGALEVKLSKEQIFEAYVNQVYLGRRNTMGLHGFGQAAQTYFSKELLQLSLPEAALLAGLVQRPSFFDPVRHANRAMARRNVVLALMASNGYITDAERNAAAAAPVAISPRSTTDTNAPWFIELAMDDLQSHDAGTPKGNVYTTIDPGLQRAAEDAVRLGLREVDRRAAPQADHALPQVALVALDPRTGEVKALVGGRDFGANQVNHAVAMRQPGSVFKPFVYAAALGSDWKAHRLTPASTVEDAPTTFRFAGHDYSPSNFGEHFHGTVTLRQALAKSMNVAAVSVAGQAGYERVVKVARASGFNDGLRATPALALGAYEATPLEVGGAYTVFASGGEYVPPAFVSEVRARNGQVSYRAPQHSRRVLEPSVAFLMQDMLSEVLRSGTGAAARARGLDVPAAGKTGTSRDGWFAGYISNLICVVWVGFDDNRDLDLEGSKSALPIWTEFMKQASSRARYREELNERPATVVSAQIDSDTGMLAGPACTNTRREYFIAGTQPNTTCAHDQPPAGIQSSVGLVSVSYPAK